MMIVSLSPMSNKKQTSIYYAFNRMVHKNSTKLFIFFSLGCRIRTHTHNTKASIYFDVKFLFALLNKSHQKWVNIAIAFSLCRQLFGEQDLYFNFISLSYRNVYVIFQNNITKGLRIIGHWAMSKALDLC